MHLQVRQRVVVPVEGNVLVVVEGLPDVVGAPVVDPKRIGLALARHLGGIAGPGLGRRDKARLARGCGEAPVLVQAHRARGHAVDDPHRGLDAVVAELAQQVVGDARIALHGIAGPAVVLVARVDEDVLVAAPVEIEKAVSPERVAVLQIELAQASGEARHDLPVRHRLARRIHEALIESQAPFAVDRGQVHLAPRRRRQHQVRVARGRGHVDLLDDQEHAAGLERLDDGGDALADGPALGAGERVAHRLAARHQRRLEGFGLQRGQHRVAAPDPEAFDLAAAHRLVDVERRPAAGIGRAHVALLVAAQAAHPGARLAEIAGEQRQIDDSGDVLVVLEAPDQALLVVQQGTPPGAAHLRRGDPLGGLMDLGRRHPGDGGGLGDHLLERPVGHQARALIGLEGLPLGVRADETDVVPAPVANHARDRVQERDIAAGLDLQMQHPIGPARGFGGRDGHGAARIDDDHAPGLDRLGAEGGAFQVQALAAQVRHHVAEEIVGLGLVGIGADDQDGVGEFGIDIGVGERAHARVTGGVDLAVVGRPVVDRGGAGADPGEEEAADRPVVLEPAAATAVIEELHADRIRPPAIENRLDHPRTQVDGIFPVHRLVAVALGQQRPGQARLGRPVRRIEGLGQAGAAHRGHAVVHLAGAVGQDHHVMAAAVALGHHRMHGRRDPVLHGAERRAEVDPQRVVPGRRAAVAPHGPLEHPVAAADDAELADRIETFGPFRR